MLIISQNLSNYSMPFPDDVIYRINLAWINTIDELNEILIKHKQHKIFLDLPTHRTKPPVNRYTIEELIPTIRNFSNISYFAISNANHSDDILSIQEKLPDGIIVVPKIESILGIENIKDIIDSINANEKIIMLDHDDLYRSIEKNDEPISKFHDSIDTLVEFCNKNNVILLRTRGVIFADD
jgi:hypothetical protein